jgi:uncharacterized membrane protein YccC
MTESARRPTDGEGRIGKQVVLPWSKAVEIAGKSIRVRFWRSMITMSSIILAIAFLMSIWTSTAITAALSVGPGRDIESIKERIYTVRAALRGEPEALSHDAVEAEFASDIEDAIDAVHEQIEENLEKIEDAGTDERKKLEAGIVDLNARLEPDQHVQLLYDHLMSERRRYGQIKGRIDTILLQERGGAEAEGGAPAEAEEEESDAPVKPSRAAVGSSVVDFINHMSATDTWLAVLALLVCLVGIANSMFMTVQERFREIGTMKCLGALDGFIVKIFLIESAALGFIGTLLGIVVGLLLSTVRQLFVYGGPVLTYFPFFNVLLAGMLAALIGLLLSIGAAIWPAQRAARMEPVEAMRVEE